MAHDHRVDDVAFDKLIVGNDTRVGAGPVTVPVGLGGIVGPVSFRNVHVRIRAVRSSKGGYRKMLSLFYILACNLHFVVSHGALFKLEVCDKFLLF